MVPKGTSFESFLKKDSKKISGVNNIIKRASVLEVYDNYCIVDIDDKATPVIPLQELSDIPGKIKKGDTFDVLVKRYEDKEGNMIVSHTEVPAKRALDSAIYSLNNSSFISCHVKNVVPGGLSVDIGGLTAFLPASLIGDNESAAPLENYLDRDLKVIVVKIGKTNNIIVSNRAYIEQVMKQEKCEMISKMKVGDVVDGEITSLVPFGAFITIVDTNIKGLLHLSEISWNKIKKPEEVLQVGQIIKVSILGIDEETISFSKKALEKRPWEVLMDDVNSGKVKIGDIVECTMLKVMSSAGNIEMYVKVFENVNGIVLSPDFTWYNIPNKFITSYYKNKIAKSKEEKAIIKAKILKLDEEKERVVLSIREVEENPFENDKIMKSISVDSKHHGKIIDLNEECALIKLENGIEGILKNTDVSWTKRVKSITENFKVNDEIDVKVLSNDSGEVIFGVKQLTENPWVENRFTVKSTHKGTVVDIVKESFVVELEDGFEAVCKKKHVPADMTLEIGNQYDFKIIEYSPADFYIEVVEDTFKYNFNKKTVKKLEDESVSTIADIIKKV